VQELTVMAMADLWRGRGVPDAGRGRFTDVRETIATLREVSLFPWDLAPVVPASRPGDDVVVLVHGFMATAGVFRPMKRRLEEGARAVVASFTHPPGAGVVRIARKLAELVGAIPDGRKIHLVGHSLGGLVSRWYVQELGGHAKVAQTISLGAPFHGTTHAHKIPVLVGRDLTAHSKVLRRIRERAHLFDVPHTSIVAKEDRMVVPNESAVFPRGKVVLLPGRGHNTLLYDAESIGHVVARIRGK
jgi:pimeloyl-ACP methyl ester carboxylesterase